jgi:Barstar (barnase inhibitor)
MVRSDQALLSAIVAAFDPETDLSQDLAFRLLINTPVTLFWRSSVLDETTQWLSAHGYQVTHLDASRWMTEEDLHRDIAKTLDFPDYYGRNLDALNDCMRDVVTHDYGWSPRSTGLALVFTGYDDFATHCPRAAQIVLDIMADQSRSAALFGRRLMCLVQSNDQLRPGDPVPASRSGTCELEPRGMVGLPPPT